MNNEGQPLSLKLITKGENASKRIYSSFLSRSEDCDYRIDRLLVVETRLKMLFQIGQVDAGTVIDCYANDIVGANTSDCWFKDFLRSANLFKIVAKILHHSPAPLGHE